MCILFIVLLICSLFCNCLLLFTFAFIFIFTFAFVNFAFNFTFAFTFFWFYISFCCSLRFFPTFFLNLLFLILLFRIFSANLRIRLNGFLLLSPLQQTGPYPSNLFQTKNKLIFTNFQRHFWSCRISGSFAEPAT